jgi:integrase
MTKKRTPTGECSIVVRSGRLRLRISRSVSATGNQQEIGLGMADTQAARVVAAQILADVQLDIYNGKLDPTLAKYKRIEQFKRETVYGLWSRYVDYKSASIKPSTLDYYRRIIGDKLQLVPQAIDRALDVRDWLLTHTTPAFTARILIHYSSAVDWGIRHDLIELVKNPYDGMGQDLKPNTQPPGADAFSRDEKESILNAFLTSHFYDYYYPFVYFLFLTGCRPSEAIGLRWRDISEDLEFIKFSGSIVQVNSAAVRMEGSKTNRFRKFPINGELRDLLEACQSQAQKSPAHDRLVFPAPKSPKSIDYINFSKRAWAKIVTPIVGRKTTPYNCRDTFITEQVAAGIPTQVIAKWVDNSPRMIDRKYFDVSAVSFLPK